MWVTPERIARVTGALVERMGSVVAVAESVRRRHNVSALLRTCEAFGVHEVHLVTHGFRASKGAARGAERWVNRRTFETVEGSVADLRARGFAIYVADILPGAFTPESLPIDKPLAILFGSEARGVSASARALADGAVFIPMRGLTESLNVSVSASIILRTIVDRRRAIVGADLSVEEQNQFIAEWLASEERAARGMMARTEE